MTIDKFGEIHAMIIDMDGVLWREDQAIGDLPAVFAQIEGLGISAVLATNNATRTIAAYHKKLNGFGVSLHDWQIINSSQACAYFLKGEYPDGGPVYIVGEHGLEEELMQEGFYQSEQDALAVVVGLDRHITYEKLERATLLIRSSTPFIATNPDRTFPTPRGQAPGAGAIVAAIEAATNVKPIIIGKPSPEMYRIALDRLGAEPVETLVVGDRLETDIAGGQALECRTALVLSGVTTRENAALWRPSPDIVSEDLTTVMEYLCSLPH